MVSSERLIKFENEKDVRGLIGSFEKLGKSRKEAINKIFYLWYILLEPYFDKSMDSTLRQQLMSEIKADFNYCNLEFALDPYYNAIIGFIVEMTSWYFFDTQISSDEADASGKKMKEKSLIIDGQNPMALLLNKRDLTQVDKSLIVLFFDEIGNDTNSIFYKGTLPATYFHRIYLERKKNNNFLF